MKQTWKPCCRIGIALLLNFLRLESEKDSKLLPWSHLMLTVHLPEEIALLQPSERDAPCHKMFVWPLWTNTDLPGSPTRSPKMAPFQSCSWNLLLMSYPLLLSTFMTCYLQYTLCLGLCWLLLFPKIHSFPSYKIIAWVWGELHFPPLIICPHSYPPAFILVIFCFYFLIHTFQLPNRCLFQACPWPSPVALPIAVM